MKLAVAVLLALSLAACAGIKPGALNGCQVAVLYGCSNIDGNPKVEPEPAP